MGVYAGCVLIAQDLCGWYVVPVDNESCQFLRKHAFHKAPALNAATKPNFMVILLNSSTHDLESLLGLLSRRIIYWEF